tara:strand:+ start:114 stop:1265 length:1152 start_codon:yes stop_codon:yes gene_type:complete
MIIDKSLEIYTRELLTYYKNKDFVKAQDLAKLMIKKFPYNNLSWQILSFIHLEKGKIKEAYEAISKASKIDPKDFKVLINLGLILFKLRLFDDSIATFKKVLEIDNENFSAYINLGAVYQKKNDFKNAELNYLQAIKINPNSSIVYNNLANTLKDQNKLDEAEINYKKALVINPDYKKASSNLNMLLEEKKILNIIHNNKNEKNNIKRLLENPFIKTREVEQDLVDILYKINSLELNKTEGGPLFGNGKTTNYQLFDNNNQTLNTLKANLYEIMKEAVNSEIYIAESFLNILKEDSGSFPHTHIMPFDKNNNLIKRKFSLVYYVSVGDQKSSKPGIFKLENPEEEILPKDGTIIIIPADRIHSAVYNGKKDRLMIGINFYSLN